MNTTDMHIPSNKVRDIERYCHAELDSLYGNGEVGVFVRMLFEAFMGWDSTKLLLNREATVNQSDLLRFHWAVEDLKRWRPIQHIVGYTIFCGCRIDVDESTLIPRPETEEIVQKVIARFQTRRPKRILDLCTGSGCIAIALAKQWNDADVTAVDVSEQALEKAAHNAAVNGVEIDFVYADLLSGFRLDKSEFDLIISNPPYVMESEKSAMSHNVLDWEPRRALFVPDGDPLLFYRVIADIATRYLSGDGMLVFEINERLGEETVALLESKGYAAHVHSDFNGRARMVTARKSI